MDPCRYALFSATYSDPIMNKVKQFVPKTLVEHVIKLADTEVMVDEIAQLYVDLRDNSGRDVWPREEAQRLKEDFVQRLLLQRTTGGKVIIFVRSKNNAGSLAERLNSMENLQTSEFHGGLTPEERDEYFDDFMVGNRKILVATDLLARGVDVSGVSLVINFDMPYEGRQSEWERAEEATMAETYVHRVGRTGRFGANGTAVSLIATHEDDELRVTIERKYGKGPGGNTEIIHRVPGHDIAELEAVAKRVQETVRERRMARRAAKREAEAAAQEAAGGMAQTGIGEIGRAHV